MHCCSLLSRLQYRILAGKLASSRAQCRIFSISLFCFSSCIPLQKWQRIFKKKQEVRKAKSEGTKTVINIGSPVCFQEFFGIFEIVNTQANYTLQSQKHRMTFASVRNCWEVGHNRVLWQTSIHSSCTSVRLKRLMWTFHTGFRVPDTKRMDSQRCKSIDFLSKTQTALQCSCDTMRENARQQKLFVVL